MAVASSSKRPLPLQRGQKEQEELYLEERLFGVSGKKRRKAKRDVGVDEAEMERVEEMKAMEDDDLFTVDAPLLPDSFSDEEDGDEDDDDESEEGESSEGDDDDDEESEKDSEGSGSGSESDDEAILVVAEDDAPLRTAGASEPTIELPDDIYDLPEHDTEPLRGAKKAAWHDPSDDTVTIDLEANKRLKKLARGKAGHGVVGGKELEKRLREQFERLHPRPTWTSLRLPGGTPSLRTLLYTSTKSFISTDVPNINGGSARGALPQGTIQLKRLRNANQANPTAGKREAQGAGGGVMDFAFHPSQRVGVMAVAGGDRRVRFFNIDGVSNPTLMTLHIPSLPLTKTTFHPTGSSILLTGTRPFYYTYDLSTQKCLRSPRTLWSGSTGASSSAPKSLSRHAFSPDGRLLAIAGLRGAVQVLEWNGGAGAVVAELRTGRGGSIAEMVWSADSGELSVLGGRDSAEVEVWDVGQRRIVRKWRDDRAFGGTVMRRSQDGAFTAIGSNTGIVNVYSGSSLLGTRQKVALSDGVADLRPEPIKSLEHLTTPVTSIDFHPSGEMMVTASSSKRDALKLYHLPSATAFSNWPTAGTPFKTVTSAKFSSGGEYLAVGNKHGQVLLWSLSHFNS